MTFISSTMRGPVWLCIITILFISAGTATATVPEDRKTLTKPIHRVESTAAIAKNSPPTAPELERQSTEAAEIPTPQLSNAQPIATETVHSSDTRRPALADEGTKVASARPLTTPTATGPTPKETLDEAVRDAMISLDHMKANVRNYSCDFYKRELVNGRLLPHEIIKLKVRNRVTENGKIVTPFSVYMKFTAPKRVKNREVIFIENENNGKILIKEGRFLPSVWLSPNNTLVKRENRYVITEVGMTNLCERLISSARENLTVDQCKIRYLRDTKVEGRACSYLEVYRAERQPGPLSPNNVYLVQVFVDQEWNVPIRYAAFDWPETEGGNPRLVEEYTYRNIVFNQLTDKDFDYKNPEYRF